MTSVRSAVHLICNAHIDPVWLWEWEEGAAEALSTFRIAAEFCETTKGFVFVHNEALLYQWVEEYDPALFRRIQRLVRRGQWHIGGGWYLQPDCNLPSGESLVRQVLVGQRYFKNRFGTQPSVAYNFDPFGHSRGLVQILARTGYRGYIHCRPTLAQMEPPLPAPTYRWHGFDGSEVIGHLPQEYYNSLRGEAAKKVDAALDARGKHPEPTMVLWGIGNHGGGPSRMDLQQLEQLIAERTDAGIQHSTPEAFFDDVHGCKNCLPQYTHSLRHVFRGCYLSQIRVKQRHRKLENSYFATEMLVAEAWARGVLKKYPQEELDRALQDLLFVQFHDILPGSGIRAVEEGALQRMDHGLEILQRLRAKAVFGMGRTLSAASEGETPLLIHNPHPWTNHAIVDTEVQLADQHWDADAFFAPRVTLNGRRLPVQCENPASNLNLEWRKRIVFRVKLPSSQVSSLSVTFEPAPRPASPEATRQGREMLIHGRHISASVSTRFGHVNALLWRGQNVLGKRAFALTAHADTADSWGTELRKAGRVVGRFRLATCEEANRIRGFPDMCTPAVTLTEDGPVRSVVEAIFVRGESHAIVRYLFPKLGDAFDVELHILNAQPTALLKLAMPLACPANTVKAQTAYGNEACPTDGTEQVMQQWCAALGEPDAPALAILNDGTYAFSATRRHIGLSLLRSPRYAALPIPGRSIPARDHAEPIIDMGERSFRFRILIGQSRTLMRSVERKAQAFNQPPQAIPFFPSQPPVESTPPLVSLSGQSIVMTATKKSQDDDSLLIRLFEPSGHRQSTTVAVLGQYHARLAFRPFEIKTLRVDLATGAMSETALAL